MTIPPSLFLSHGAPTLAIEDTPARRYLSALSRHLPVPNAIVLVSAHYDANRVEVTCSPVPKTVHDFIGFPSELYEARYPAPGAPQLAVEIVDKLKTDKIDAVLNPTRGLDHGAWIPLRLMYPSADIPVLQVAINTAETPEYHYKLGQSLSFLRHRGILLIGSGSATHNLDEYFRGGYDRNAVSPAWVSEFSDWLCRKIEANDVNSVLHCVDMGPHGRRNHPTLDHILPLFFAMGAGWDAECHHRIHTSIAHGVLAMDAYGFGDKALLHGLSEHISGTTARCPH